MSTLTPRVDDVLACPRCHAAFRRIDGTLACANGACGFRGQVRDGIVRVTGNLVVTGPFTYSSFYTTDKATRALAAALTFPETSAN